MKKFLIVLLSLAFLLPLPAFAADQGDLKQQIDELSQQLDRLKQQMSDMQKSEAAKDEKIADVENKTKAQAAASSWLIIGGDLRSEVESLNGRTQLVMAPGHVLFGVNPVSTHVAKDNLLTNRLGLDVTAKATEDVLFHARLMMYKLWGEETAAPESGNTTADATNTGSNAFTADRFFIFDGNVTHVPKDSVLRVDQAFMTWSNMFGQPFWFSIGRRPSSGGVPTNYRQNLTHVGTGGTPGILVDYVFDGISTGIAPDIDALPGFYAKVCTGKGFDSGYRTGTGGAVQDTWLLGVNVAPIDTEDFHMELQWDRAFDMFAFPENTTLLGVKNANIGDIDQWGFLVDGKLEKLGIGDLNLFLSGAASVTHPNGRFIDFTAIGMTGVHYGLLWDNNNANSAEMKSYSGEAIYVGGRYDITSTGTKIGAEYNHGSKHWVAFAPAADDVWTSKLGIRGNAYEGYIIQGLNKKPIARHGNAFFRLGYIYYSFNDTGSNNWVGSAMSMGSLTPTTFQLFAPLKHASEIYASMNVTF